MRDNLSGISKSIQISFKFLLGLRGIVKNKLFSNVITFKMTVIHMVSADNNFITLKQKDGLSDRSKTNRFGKHCYDRQACLDRQNNNISRKKSQIDRLWVITKYILAYFKRIRKRKHQLQNLKHQLQNLKSALDHRTNMSAKSIYFHH